MDIYISKKLCTGYKQPEIHEQRLLFNYRRRRTVQKPLSANDFSPLWIKVAIRKLLYLSCKLVKHIEVYNVEEMLID